MGPREQQFQQCVLFSFSPQRSASQLLQLNTHPSRRMWCPKPLWLNPLLHPSPVPMSQGARSASASAAIVPGAATSASRVVAWPKGLKHTARPQGKLTRKPTNMQGKLANGGAFGDVLHTGTSPERLAERHTSTPRLPTSTGGSLPSSVPTSERRTSTAVAGLSTACVVGVAPVVTTRGVLLHAGSFMPVGATRNAGPSG